MNGKDRTVALPATVVRMLASGVDDALVFPDSAGGWMRASNVRRRWWAKALADAGLPADFKLHELRHTAGPGKRTRVGAGDAQSIQPVLDVGLGGIQQLVGMDLSEGRIDD